MAMRYLLCILMGLVVMTVARTVGRVGGQEGLQPVEVTLTVPLGLDAKGLLMPLDNPLTPDKVGLGKQLFFDQRLSADGTIACATCHNPQFGFTDGQPVSTGIAGRQGKRSAPTAINRAFSTSQFWDGRAASLEEQAKDPMVNPDEMGNPSHTAVVERLKGIEAYREAFKRVFAAEDFTIEHVVQAIAAYERTILSGNAPFDRFQAGDTSALSAAAQRGLELFRDKAKCANCHDGANFTDEMYHNLGVGMDQPQPDLGRYEVTNNEEDRGAFKTPTLRDIARTAPYLHDGSVKTLEDVIELYDKGGIKNLYLSPKMVPLHLTPQEKADLVEFLKSLTGEVAAEVGSR